MSRQACSGAVGVVILFLLAGCGRERRLAVAVDTTQNTGTDTSAAPAVDTNKAMTADTRAVRPDTSAAKVSNVAQQPPKQTATKRTPKPAAPTPTEHADTLRPPAAQPAETTTAAAPARTADTTAPLRDIYHQAPLDTVSQAVYDGWKQFNLNCARCHGEDVQGTTIAPHLLVSLRPDGPINTKELFMQTVCAGRPQKGMPSWCALGLDMSKIESIYSYVKGRSDGKIHPGRPAVKPTG